MSKMTEMKRNMKKKEDREVLEETLRRLELATELKNQGKEDEGNKVFSDITVWLEDLLQEIDAEDGSNTEEFFDRSLLPQAGEVVAEGKKSVLKVISENEREEYLKVSYENSVCKGMYKEEAFRDSAWKEFLSEEAFVCSIYDKESATYVGYCSIRNLKKTEWELVIELMPEFCHHGYGTEALPLLMEFLHKVAGRRFFRVRVEVDNRPSQKLMNKLGAYPNGISEFMLHGEEITRFQMEHKDEITEDIRAVAEEFCMEAEDILGYVLEYRFDMETDRGRKNQ